MQNRGSSMLLVVVVLLAAVGAHAGDFYATEANTRGCERIACLSVTGSSTQCDATPASYFQASNATMQGFPFPAYTPRQFVAMPFRYSGDGTYEILRVRMYFKIMNVQSLPFAVFLYKANATNPRLPGDIIPGTPALGQLVNFTRVANVSNDVLRQYWEMVTTLPTPVNVTAGLYYIVVAGFNSSGPSASYNLIAGWQNFTLNSDGEPYYSLGGFDGRWNAATSLYPYMVGSIPTSTWQPVNNSVSCVWPEGIRRETVVLPPPPDFYVRYPIDTDLNDYVPSEFILSVTSSLNATLADLTAANASFPYPPSILGVNGTQIYVVNARRATLAVNETVSVDGTSVDFYIGGPHRAALGNLALGFALDELRAYGIPILSAPLQVNVTSA